MTSFRAQVDDGTLPNFTRAAREAKVTPRTAKHAYQFGYPATAGRGPLPAIRIVLAGPSVEIEPEPAPASAAPNRSFVASPPSAPPSFSPAPSQPPETRPAFTGFAPASASVGPAEVRSVAAPPAQALPASISAAPGTEVVAPRVASDPDLVYDLEAKAIRATRHAAEGVAVISTKLLAALVPCATAARLQLERALETDGVDARWTADMLQRIAESVAKASGSLARLVEAQSVLDGRPNQRIAVSDDRAANAAGIQTMRAALAELDAWSQRERDRKSLEPIDVTPVCSEGGEQ
jgi:hypothetical protein